MLILMQKFQLIRLICNSGMLDYLFYYTGFEFGSLLHNELSLINDYKDGLLCNK